MLFNCLGAQAQLSIRDTLEFDVSTPDSMIINTLTNLHFDVSSAESSEAIAESENLPEIHFDDVVYSDDRAIRVFRYSWENCGVYCYTLDVVLIAYIDATKRKVRFIALGNRVGGKVYSIKNIEDGKYLIFSRSMSREQGGGSASHLTSYLVTIQEEAKTLWSFDIFSHDQDENAILNLEYDDKAKTVEYGYKFYEYGNYEKTYIKTGSWLFRDGNFSVQNEKTVYYNE